MLLTTKKHQRKNALNLKYQSLLENKIKDNEKIIKLQDKLIVLQEDNLIYQEIIINDLKKDIVLEKQKIRRLKEKK